MWFPAIRRVLFTSKGLSPTTANHAVEQESYGKELPLIELQDSSIARNGCFDGVTATLNVHNLTFSFPNAVPLVGDPIDLVLSEFSGSALPFERCHETDPEALTKSPLIGGRLRFQV